MASHLHSTAMTAWGASGSPLHDTESRGASGGRSQGAVPQPLALAQASGSDWPWLEAAVQMAWRSCGGPPPEPAASDDRGSEWTTMPRVATRTPKPATRSIAAARAFTMRTMERWGVVALGADAAAVVTELMTNALRHALAQPPDDTATPSSWPIRLGLADPGPYVICAVADPSTDVPTPRHADWQDEAGRGLLVVASLSDRWGYCAAPADRGKVVWAAFATPSRSR
ncbi:MAG: ATP-binding protein [Streptosporangiaceae bacterium]